MGEMSIRDLMKRHPDLKRTDIDMALQHQEHQRRAGMPVQPLDVQLGFATPKKRKARVSEFIDYRQGMATQGPKRAMNPRAASWNEYDFFGGNMSVAFDYQDTMTERLLTTAPTQAKAYHAMSILWTICRNLRWESYECTKTASQLCEIMKTNKAHMSRALNLLEKVGAIQRINRGQIKIITVTPEGAYRGNINEHSNVVGKYELDVIQGGKGDE